MIASSTVRLAFYPVTTRAAQNEHNGDREISSPGAAPGAAIMNPENPSDLGVESPWTIRFGTTVR